VREVLGLVKVNTSDYYQVKTRIAMCRVVRGKEDVQEQYKVSEINSSIQCAFLCISVKRD
jgi:hypothetical protein